jgi:hypothetical protein
MILTVQKKYEGAGRKKYEEVRTYRLEVSGEDRTYRLEA